jgi:hypothetical protein
MYKDIRIYIIFLVISIILTGLCFPQENKNSISGHIYDQESGKPIENANIFISNTTCGSSTNVDGYYMIRQMPAGMQELVVTIIGYEYAARKILVKADSELRFDFRLKPVIYELEPTLVEGSIPEDWYTDLAFFKKHFLGQSVFADKCIIENEIYLNFAEPNDTFFLASADRPLIILNKSLGYRLECVLIHFAYNYDTKKWSWSIKPKFTELVPGTEAEAAEWKQNRIDAYQGSLYHFLKSFRTRQLKEENFDIYEVNAAGEKIPQQRWHQTIIDYDDYLSAGVIDSDKKLHFNNFLFVIYKKTAVSWIGLNLPDITLDESGYPEEDNPYEIYGVWAFRGVGDLLPKNFILQGIF